MMLDYVVIERVLGQDNWPSQVNIEILKRDRQQVLPLKFAKNVGAGLNSPVIPNSFQVRSGTHHNLPACTNFNLLGSACLNYLGSRTEGQSRAGPSVEQGNRARSGQSSRRRRLQGHCLLTESRLDL